VLAKVHGFILIGIDHHLCEVEVDASQRGLQRSAIVGLAQTAVKESVERVHRAIVNSGFPYPDHAVLINLAPADVKKEGPALDLPMAIGLLRAGKSIQSDLHKEYLIAGELALDGRCRWRCWRGRSNSAASSCRPRTRARRPWWRAWRSSPSARSPTRSTS
jgi:magnesium chelatase family protein